MVKSLKNFMDLFILHTEMSSTIDKSTTQLVQGATVQETRVKENVPKGKAVKPTAGTALLASVRSKSTATNVAVDSASEKAPAKAGGGAVLAAQKDGAALAAQKGAAAPAPAPL
jgi:hypothetical protein